MFVKHLQQQDLIFALAASSLWRHTPTAEKEARELQDLSSFTHFSAFVLTVSRFCQRHLTQHHGDLTCHGGCFTRQHDVLLSAFVCWLLLMDTTCLSSLSSLYSPATSGCSRSHLPPLCPLTTWHLFRSSPSAGRRRAFGAGGHNAAILENQWQINRCYLFFPCLCCYWFFF